MAMTKQKLPPFYPRHRVPINVDEEPEEDPIESSEDEDEAELSRIIAEVEKKGNQKKPKTSGERPDDIIVPATPDEASYEFPGSRSSSSSSSTRNRSLTSRIMDEEEEEEEEEEEVEDIEDLDNNYGNDSDNAETTGTLTFEGEPEQQTFASHSRPVMVSDFNHYNRYRHPTIDNQVEEIVAHEGWDYEAGTLAVDTCKKASKLFSKLPASHPRGVFWSHWIMAHDILLLMSGVDNAVFVFSELFELHKLLKEPSQDAVIRRTPNSQSAQVIVFSECELTEQRMDSRSSWSLMSGADRRDSLIHRVMQNSHGAASTLCGAWEKICHELGSVFFVQGLWRPGSNAAFYGDMARLAYAFSKELRKAVADTDSSRGNRTPDCRIRDRRFVYTETYPIERLEAFVQRIDSLIDNFNVVRGHWRMNDPFLGATRIGFGEGFEPVDSYITQELAYFRALSGGLKSAIHRYRVLDGRMYLDRPPDSNGRNA